MDAHLDPLVMHSNCSALPHAAAAACVCISHMSTKKQASPPHSPSSIPAHAFQPMHSSCQHIGAGASVRWSGVGGRPSCSLRPDSQAAGAHAGPGHRPLTGRWEILPGSIVVGAWTAEGWGRWVGSGLWPDQVYKCTIMTQTSRRVPGDVCRELHSLLVCVCAAALVRRSYTELAHQRGVFGVTAPRFSGSVPDGWWKLCRGKAAQGRVVIAAGDPRAMWFVAMNA